MMQPQTLHSAPDRDLQVEAVGSLFRNGRTPIPPLVWAGAGRVPEAGAGEPAGLERDRGLLLAGLGLGAGFLSGFLGIGGGAVIVPALVAAVHFPIKRAVGTSLATIIPIALVGILTECLVRRSNIHWTLGFLLTVASLLGSWVGGKILPRVPEKTLRVTFAAVLALAAYRMAAPAPSGTGLLALEDAPLLGYLLIFVVGGIAGLASVCLGLGGGIIMVPAFTLLLGGFPFHAARATALLQVVPTAGLGAFQHARLGTVDGAAVRRLIPAGLVGAILGVVAVNHLPVRPCQLVFALLLAFAAARLVLTRSAREDTVGSAQIRATGLAHRAA
jgi:uncharacterized membrane protein YfcA